MNNETSMKFITTDGYLTIEENNIIETRVIKTRRQTIIIGIFGFFYFMEKFSNNMEEYIEKGKRADLIKVIAMGIIFLGFIFIGIMLLFKAILTKKVNLFDIAAIKITKTEAGLVKEVQITNKRKRVRTYMFRNLEKEYKKFVEYATLINPNIVVVGE